MRVSMAQSWFDEGFDKGFDKGREEELKRTAKNMKNMGINIDIILKATGLSYEEIKNL